MLEAIGEIREFTHGMDRVAFKADAKTVKAVCMNFNIIGEAVRHIPEEIRDKSPQIPWVRVRGMRNFIVHVYHAIDERCPLGHNRARSRSLRDRPSRTALRADRQR